MGLGRDIFKGIMPSGGQISAIVHGIRSGESRRAKETAKSRSQANVFNIAENKALLHERLKAVRDPAYADDEVTTEQEKLQLGLNPKQITHTETADPRQVGMKEPKQIGTRGPGHDIVGEAEETNAPLELGLNPKQIEMKGGQPATPVSAAVQAGIEQGTTNIEMTPEVKKLQEVKDRFEKINNPELAKEKSEKVRDDFHQEIKAIEGEAEYPKYDEDKEYNERAIRAEMLKRTDKYKPFADKIHPQVKWEEAEALAIEKFGKNYEELNAIEKDKWAYVDELLKPYKDDEKYKDLVHWQKNDKIFEDHPELKEEWEKRYDDYSKAANTRSAFWDYRDKLRRDTTDLTVEDFGFSKEEQAELEELEENHRGKEKSERYKELSSKYEKARSDMYQLEEDYWTDLDYGEVNNANIEFISKYPFIKINNKDNVIVQSQKYDYLAYNNSLKNKIDILIKNNNLEVPDKIKEAINLLENPKESDITKKGLYGTDMYTEEILNKTKAAKAYKKVKDWYEQKLGIKGKPVKPSNSELQMNEERFYKVWPEVKANWDKNVKEKVLDTNSKLGKTKLPKKVQEAYDYLENTAADENDKEVLDNINRSMKVLNDWYKKSMKEIYKEK